MYHFSPKYISKTVTCETIYTFFVRFHLLFRNYVP